VAIQATTWEVVMRHHSLIAAAAVFLCTSSFAAGPFAPAAGQPGSNAVSKNSTSIVQWATGYQNYLPGTDVDATWRTPDKALGAAAGTSFDIVALGNGGSITLTFGGSIFNGAGADFAVFENAFSDTFLDLARVEVSSNGVEFFRFPAYSLTPGPVSAFGSVDPTNLGGPLVTGTTNTFYEGFAGKYKQGFGTPFDLSALAGTGGLDLDHVQFVRLVDVLGNGTEFDDFPGTPNRIYDPYKTTGSGGFDLDAVGVMHFAAAAPVPEPEQIAMLGLGLALIVPFVRRRAQKKPLTSALSAKNSI